ncbi:MAG: sugar transporter permease protein, partial [Rhizobium sp.]|nr:sugar transporter permease protein [Rhizobium sp.]
MSAINSAHSVVEPSVTTKRVAAAIVILYALITLVPLVWIFLTSIKSPPDSISYPPK